MRATIRRHWFLILLAVYVLYALAFVYRCSVVAGGQRYFVLMDDAMISMTYARNLAEGHGAVWYPGAEPVQGYSNPLWMLYMAAVHCLPLPASLISLPIQLTGVALLAAMMFFIKTITERLAGDRLEGGENVVGAGSTTSEPPCLAPFLAVLLSAFYFPLNNWTLRGMEVGLVALGASVAVWAAVQCEAGRRWQWWLMPLLGLLTVVRMDAAVIGVAVLAWLIWAIPAHRGRTLVMGLIWLAIFLIGQMIFQGVYYHDWLPNTYYVKLAGVPLERRTTWGLYVLLNFIWGSGLWVLVPAAVYAATARTKAVWLLLAVIAAQTSYSVYVGGDAWEWWGGANRYLAVVAPLFFIMVALGLEIVAARLAKAVPAAAPYQALAAVALGLLILVRVNGYPSGAGKPFDQWLLLESPPELAEHAQNVRLALAVRKMTTPQARLAVIWAGIIPYFSERQGVDLLGKNDRKIAKGPNRPYWPPPLPFFQTTMAEYCWPGHTKYDYRYSIGKLAPDIITRSWLGMDKIENLLHQRYEPLRLEDLNATILVKKGSAEVKAPSALHSGR